MEGGELQSAGKSLQKWKKLQMWLIEHIWTHRMLEIQQAVEASCWPDLDSEPLGLEDPCRLRVASALVYSIVRIRDLDRFEEVVTFLETTYRLLPGLVTPIKHMKILFGLNTLVIMRMLRERRGMIDIVLKTSQMFPSKLPQYQDQCSPHEMFLMRKSNLDFRVLAQGLAMDKDKLEDYMKTRMEEQFGERYAQKVEERLLDYLQKLEEALPGDTVADTILKKQSPVTEEEKQLLEVISSDSAHFTAALNNLLHCDAASCRHPSRSVLEGSSSSSVVQKRPRTVTEVPEVTRSSSSLHFCSKHQRWSRSILQECPDQPPTPSKTRTRTQTQIQTRTQTRTRTRTRSQSQTRTRSQSQSQSQTQTSFSCSPLLFPSTSSTATSSDLTPSDLTPSDLTPSDLVPPGPPQRPELSRSSSRESPGPGGFSPLLFLPDLHPVSSRTPSGTGPSGVPQDSVRPGPPPSGSAETPRVPQNSVRSSETTGVPQNPVRPGPPPSGSAETSRLPQNSIRPGPPPSGGPAETTRVPQNSVRPGPPPSGGPAETTRVPQNSVRPGPPPSGGSAETSRVPQNSVRPGPPPSGSAETSRLPQNSIRPGPPPSGGPAETTRVPQDSVRPGPPPSSGSGGPAETSRVQLRVSVPSQAVLLRSRMLQPLVVLNRLSDGVTRWSSSTGGLEPASSDDEEEEEEEEEEEGSSFDVNCLYSSFSSISSCEESFDSDPEYKPGLKSLV